MVLEIRQGSTWCYRSFIWVLRVTSSGCYWLIQGSKGFHTQTRDSMRFYRVLRDAGGFRRGFYGVPGGGGVSTWVLRGAGGGFDVGSTGCRGGGGFDVGSTGCRGGGGGGVSMWVLRGSTQFPERLKTFLKPAMILSQLLLRPPVKRKSK